MRVAVFSAKPYDRTHLAAAATGSGHELDFLEAKLSAETVSLASGYPAICAFVHDELEVLRPSPAPSKTEAPAPRKSAVTTSR